jgi:transposase
MHRQKISSSKKRDIVRLVYDRGNTTTQAAAILGLKASSVRNFLARYQTTGRCDDAREENSGRPPKVTPDAELVAIQTVMDNPTATLSSITVALEEDCDVSVSIPTACRIFKANSITQKSLAEVPRARNSLEVRTKRRDHAAWMVGLVGFPPYDADLWQDFANRVIYVDESGYNWNIHRKRGWSKKGDRAFVSTASQRGGNVSCFGALSPTRGFWVTSKLGPFTTMSFIAELQCLLDKHATTIPQNGFIFMMDNVPFHHSRAIRDLLEAAGHTLIFIPPYSPFLNAIENAFSKLKIKVGERLSGMNRSDAFLSDIINECGNSVSLNNCVNYHRHTFTYVNRCLDMSPIMQ